MAEIYTKATDSGFEKGVILDPIQALRYPFHVGDWTRLKVAMIWSYTSPTSPNNNFAGGGSYVVPVRTVKDRMYFGLKKYSLEYPGTKAGEYFLGLKSYGVNTFIGFGPNPFSSGNPHGDTMIHGVHHPDGTSGGNTLSDFQITGSGSFSGTGNPFGMVCMDMTISNKHQSNQQISYKYAFQGGINDTRQSSIDSLMDSLTYTDAGTLDFNNGGVPYETPDSFFMFIPHKTLRLRVFALRVIRVS